MSQFSLFGRIKDKLQERKQKSRDLEELRSILLQSVMDGRICDDDLNKISSFCRQSLISDQDFSQVRKQVLTQLANQAMADRRVSEVECASLMHIATRLGTPNQEITELKQNIGYFAYLHALETLPFDKLPAIGQSNVVLQKGEINYFSEAADLFEERVVNRKIVGKSKGVSIRIMKGVTYRVGQSRGQIQSERNFIPVSLGEFTVTNRRLIFTGDRKSVNAPFSKVLNLEMFADGIRYSLTNRQTPVVIILKDRSRSEVLALYLSRIMNS